MLSYWYYLIFTTVTLYATSTRFRRGVEAAIFSFIAVIWGIVTLIFYLFVLRKMIGEMNTTSLDLAIETIMAIFIRIGYPQVANWIRLGRIQLRIFIEGMSRVLRNEPPHDPLMTHIRAYETRVRELESKPHDCSICQEKKIEKKDLHMTPCFHWFHAECMKKWIIEGNDTCPVCRTRGYDPTRVEGYFP